MDNLVKLLKNIGLTNKESCVYLALIESGPALIAQIARKTNIHRPDLYKILPSLQTKGLITIAPRGKQKRFVAESPNKLESILGSIKLDFDKLLPSLNELYDRPSKRPIIKFLEGKEGIASVLEDLLANIKRGGVYYRYSSRRATMESEKYIPKTFRARRDAKQIERFMITDELSDHQKRTPTLNRAYKTVPVNKGLFDDNVLQLIYGNRVVFADLDSVSAIQIENDTIAKFQKKIFKILFELL